MIHHGTATALSISEYPLLPPKLSLCSIPAPVFVAFGYLEVKREDFDPIKRQDNSTT